MLITPVHLVLRLRVTGAVSLLPICAVTGTALLFFYFTHARKLLIYQIFDMFRLRLKFYWSGNCLNLCVASRLVRTVASNHA
jgi:hypothetical protein